MFYTHSSLVKIIDKWYNIVYRSFDKIEDIGKKNDTI